jgi:hypothetical protein
MSHLKSQPSCRILFWHKFFQGIWRAHYEVESVISKWRDILKNEMLAPEGISLMETLRLIIIIISLQFKF